MSRARVARKLTIAVLVAAAVAMAGCIFSPSETPPPPPQPPIVIDTPEKLIEELSAAYQTRSYARLAPLFHDDYLFILQPNPMDPLQPENWGKTEELRIHKRMFEPQNIGPSEEPLPTELWLVAVDITLTGNRPFDERPEFYASATNPEGLNASNWKAWGTEYTTSVLFQTQGETDYQVTGKAWFVIVQDLSKTPGAAGSFLLYQWQDLGTLKPNAGPPI
jgi:hypothetical protein